MLERCCLGVPLSNNHSDLRIAQARLAGKVGAVQQNCKILQMDDADDANCEEEC